MRRVFGCGAVMAMVLGGCGDDSSGTSSEASDSSGGTDASASASTTMTTTNGSMSADDSSTGTASTTASESSGETTTTADDGADTTTSSADGTTTTGGSDSSTTGAVTAEGTESDSDTDTGDVCRGKGMAPEIEFSYIWIANSTEGTVSKINTFTGVEEGRYQSSPENGPFPIGDGPSRTSVNLLGDVAVANRNGGVTKFAADIEDCIDTNANGMIDTSTGPLDVLPWGEDECMLWHHATPAAAAFNEGPRPIAWEAAVDPITCVPDLNPRLWFGYYEFSTNTAFFERVDGDTGVTLDGVDVQWSGLNWGPYGGAVNADGDFWVMGWQVGPTVRIDSDTLTVDVAGAVPNDWFYGLALDQQGEPWVGGLQLHHYDTQAGAWESFPMQSTNYRGLQIDTLGRAFIASNSPCGLAVFDTVAEQVIDDLVPLPGCFTPVGVSIDVEGYVWVVDEGGWAYKVDPDNYNVELQVDGLVNPYTYSDMTGAGLALQIMPM